MTLTNLFFGLALGISLFFAVCFCALFIAYLVIYHRVNKNFKAVDHDYSNFNDFHLDFYLVISSLGLGDPDFSSSILVETQ